MSGPKATSAEYGRDMQLAQAEKYRNRENNNWKRRIALAKRLVERHVFPRLQDKRKSDTVVVDVGCSIGTFAIEFAKMGCRSYGIDFDPSGLEIARELACEENTNPEFVCGDVADWSAEFPKIDIAICFDIFEHLHDDELGACLTAVRKQLSEKGTLVFHTAPTQYDYIFFRKPRLRYPLLPFRRLSPKKFAAISKAYSLLLDIWSVWRTGLTHKERIKKSGHCNPLTRDRLKDILERSGYECLVIETANVGDYMKKVERQFERQPITHRNLYGVAVPAATDGGAR